MAKVVTINKFTEMFLLYKLTDMQSKYVRKEYQGKYRVFFLVGHGKDSLDLDTIIHDALEMFPTIKKFYLVAENLSPVIRAKYSGNERYTNRKEAIQVIEFDYKVSGLFETQILFTN